MSKNGNKGPVLAFFSDAEIALREEVRHHNDLMEKIRLCNPDDGGAIIGEIAAHCNVAMDGNYTQEELERLYPILLEKLKAMRKIIITPPQDIIH